jgi:hypothetical protein
MLLLELPRMKASLLNFEDMVHKLEVNGVFLRIVPEEVSLLDRSYHLGASASQAIPNMSLKFLIKWRVSSELIESAAKAAMRLSSASTYPISAFVKANASAFEA